MVLKRTAYTLIDSSLSEEFAFAVNTWSKNPSGVVSQ